VTAQSSAPRPGDPEAGPAATRDPRSLPRVLSREFPDWQIDVHPDGAGICTAFWRSPDGHSRRFLVARSSGALLARLRALKPVP
jgi:hypothetical protein